MRVTLIFNGVGIAGFNPQRNVGDKEGFWISHGLASIGAYAKQQGYKVDLIDMRQLGGFYELNKLDSDVYGISIAPLDYWYSLKTILLLKRNNSKCKIIIGGIHPTLFPEKFIFDAIDTIVQGEGEVTFVKLLKRIEAGLPLPRIITGEKPDLNELPWIDRELFPYYSCELNCVHNPGQRCPTVTMTAGRGCPHQCTFCQPAQNAVFGNPYRKRNPKDIIEELDFLKEKYNYNNVLFWDDAFTTKRKWVDEFCNLYHHGDLTIWSRADVICENEDMIKNLAEVGMTWLSTGYESGSQRILDFIKKGITVEQNIESAKICHKYGIKVFGTYMYGLPTETKEEAKMTHDMINEINPEFRSPFYFNPIPGTEIYDYCKENDLINSGTEETIRTAYYQRAIKDIDYDYLDDLLEEDKRIRSSIWT